MNMKHIFLSFQTSINTLMLNILPGCKKLPRREFFLWMIFLIILCISSIIFLRRLDTPADFWERPWQWHLFLYSLIFSISYFLFLLISSLFSAAGGLSIPMKHCRLALYLFRHIMKADMCMIRSWVCLPAIILRKNSASQPLMTVQQTILCIGWKKQKHPLRGWL